MFINKVNQLSATVTILLLALFGYYITINPEILNILEVLTINSLIILLAIKSIMLILNSLFNKAQLNSLENIYIYQGNIHQMLDEYCQEESISEIWILFPDPWPKKRHFKRRLIDKLFFKKIYRYLKFGGIINIASDSKSYISQILRNVYLVKEDFQWLNQTKLEWNYNVEILPETKYYRKALEKCHEEFCNELGEEFEKINAAREQILEYMSVNNRLNRKQSHWPLELLEIAKNLEENTIPKKEKKAK